LVTKKKRIPISVYEDTFRLLDHLRKAAAWDTFLLALAKGEPFNPQPETSAPRSPMPPPAEEIVKPAALPAPTKPEPIYCYNDGVWATLQKCERCRNQTARLYYECRLVRIKKNHGIVNDAVSSSSKNT
jgi:hypothetical protein